jgi:DNA-directed RNA polymerase specialized sigma24 family protein
MVPNREGFFVSTSQAVALHLPFLRRYARALTGNQASGDSYVAATLEALIEEPALLDQGVEPRVALYRLFTKIWNSVAVNNSPDPADRGLPIDQRIAQITSRPRQAFLPIALEGFSEADAATVLDVDARELTRLVEESGRELAAEIATDVLIIEDEPLIAMDLEGLVQGLDHRVIGVARTHSDIVRSVETRGPSDQMKSNAALFVSVGTSSGTRLAPPRCLPDNQNAGGADDAKNIERTDRRDCRRGARGLSRPAGACSAGDRHRAGHRRPGGELAPAVMRDQFRSRRGSHSESAGM